VLGSKIVALVLYPVMVIFWNETKDQLKGEWHQFDRPLPLVLNKQPSENK
jgi:hypothetical protein